MRHRACGGLGHHAGQARTAALGNDHAVSAGAISRPDDGAQIVGVGDLVAHHDQGRLVLGGGICQNIVYTDVLPHRCQSDDALMGVGAAHAVQLPPVGLHHHDARRPGLGGDVAQGLVHLTLLDENFVDAGLRPQGFDHRVAAFNEAVGLGGQLVFSFVCHIEILS